MQSTEQKMAEQISALSTQQEITSKSFENFVNIIKMSPHLKGETGEGIVRWILGNLPRELWEEQYPVTMARKGRSTGRIDFVVFLPPSRTILPIDAKFNLPDKFLDECEKIEEQSMEDGEQKDVKEENEGKEEQEREGVELERGDEEGAGEQPKVIEPGKHGKLVSPREKKGFEFIFISKEKAKQINDMVVAQGKDIASYISPADNTTSFALIFVPDGIYTCLTQDTFSKLKMNNVIPVNTSGLFAIIHIVHRFYTLINIAEITKSAKELSRIHDEFAQCLANCTASIDKALKQSSDALKNVEKVKQIFEASSQKIENVFEKLNVPQDLKEREFKT
ncbi:MAG: DNA recombination protein RmuC [Candidatus Sigynarchaeota archaeon]